MDTSPLIAAGLDAGSNFTRCIVGVLEDNRLRVLGYGSAPSAGWAKGRITDQKALSDSIRAAVAEAETVSQVSVGHVVAGFGGPTLRAFSTRGRIDLGRPRELDQRDITRAMNATKKVLLPEDSMILQLLPQDFVVDDQPGFHDPRGMVASILEANAQLVTVASQEHTNLVGAINGAHLSVDETVHEGVAGCYASVLPEDRRDGVVYVNVGAQSSEMICYLGDSAQTLASLKICGDHFTRDLAHAFRLTFEAAAVVKHEFGGASAAAIPEASFVELPDQNRATFGEERAPKEAQRLRISQILEARTVELFEMVRSELVRVGMQRAISSGIVLSGGGSFLGGMCDVAERVLDCPARIGLAQGYIDWPEELADPTWTTASGLAMYAARLRSQVDLERQAAGLLGRMLR